MDTFDEILERMKIATNTKNDNQLSLILKLATNSVISGWKRRKTIPTKRINQICFDFGVNKTWLLTGTGPKFNSSPKNVPQIELLTLFSTLSTNNDIEIPFTLIDPINFLLQEMLYTKLILNTFNTIYDANPYYEDIPMTTVTELAILFEDQPKITEKIIAFVFESIKKASEGYFLEAKSFFLIFENNDELEDLIEFVGYKRNNPIIGKQLAKKAILEFIENFFMFEQKEIYMYLKNNVHSIRTKWEIVLSNRSRDPMAGFVHGVHIDPEEYEFFEIIDNEDPQNLDTFYIITDRGKRIYDLYKQMIS